MEVWWIGSFSSPKRMLVVLALTFVLVFVLNRTAGFRSTKDVRLADAAMDSVEALAIGLICVALVLVLIREITPATPLREVLGKMVFEATPFVIGVGFARHFLRRSRTEGDDDEHDDDDATADGGEPAINATVADVGATLIGAVFIAFNIAPTDEVPMIGAALTAPWLLALVIASLVISYVIVFEAGFSKEQKRRGSSGMLQHPATETLACYLLALVAAASLLWFFGRFALDDPYQFTLTQVVVLGLPAAVGGAAGRLVV
jgi:putative integral membrane protein (TIGR02587 family)